MKKIKSEYIYHILYVLFYLSLYFVFGISKVSFFFIGMFTAMVYINYYLLVPKFLLRKYYIVYIISCFVFITFCILFSDLVEYIVDPRESEVSFIYDIEDEDDGFLDKYGLKPYIIGFLIISLSTVIKFNNRLSKKEKENLKLSNENLSTELKFLKNQINPHFLFNVLNNLYSQVVTKSDRAPETILKLSDMLRYILYEGESEKVRIDREVEHLKNYIALQEMRDSSISQKLKFNYNLDSSIMIEPMIFIAFIENAFKHSVIDSDENGFIQINIQSKKNNIYLTVINSIPSSKFVKDKHGGIGLENVKKRLDILYRNKHMLNIEILPNLCKVELNIELNTNE